MSTTYLSDWRDKRIADLERQLEDAREQRNQYDRERNYWQTSAESAEAALAEARGDAERLDWLEAHPRDASIRIGTDIKPAIFWGVSAEPGTLMRAAIDAAIAADAKSKPEMGRRAQG